MKGMGKGAGKGALIGLVISGGFGMLTILSTVWAQDALAVRLLLAFLVAGFYGAVPGAVIGGIVGWVRGRPAPTAALPPAPTVAQVPAVYAPPPAGSSPWVGEEGEALEIRVNVLSVEPVYYPHATRAERHRHYLEAPGGQLMRWLANESRGLVAGDQVILAGTVKSHTLDYDNHPLTEVWCCRTRPAPPAPLVVFL